MSTQLERNGRSRSGCIVMTTTLPRVTIDGIGRGSVAG